MSTRDAMIRSQLAKLQQLDFAITNRIMIERERLWRKQLELYDIETKLARLLPVLPLAYIGAAIVGQEKEMERQFLINRRRELIQEIEREKQTLNDLYEKKREIARAIQELTEELTRIRVLTAREEMDEARKREIAWLLEELREAMEARDVRRVELIKRRLRSLGYMV